MNTIFHTLIEKFYQSKARIFFEHSPHFADYQNEKLKMLLTHFKNSAYGKSVGLGKIQNYTDFKRHIPLSTYENYKSFIEDEMASLTKSHFQPTSGSTYEKKWIPYTPLLKSEFDEAVAPWIFDLYQKFPGIKSGKHYWSLSWIPDELRNTVSTNDLEVFGFWKKIFMNQIMAAPNEISLVKTSEAAQIATLSYLLSCKDLSMLFVWSPTFALTLMDKIFEHRFELGDILRHGHWEEKKDLMRGLSCPKNLRASTLLKSLTTTPTSHFLKELWPKMSLISSWDTSSSKIWAKKLKDLFPKASFQGKGLFATEAVVTIPFEESYLLSYKSHFYEFKDLSSNEILPSWELEKGQIVSPVVTTGSGFFRYEMNDSLKVTGFKKGLPCLEFLGRIKDVDLVGEKMSVEFIDKLFEFIESDDFVIKGICALGVENQDHKPYYLLLFEGDSLGKKEALEVKAENFLKNNFHYSLARDLGQLDKLNIKIVKNSRKILEEIGMRKGMIEGNIKMENLQKVSSNHLKGIKWE
jgi:hypothetical protein